MATLPKVHPSTVDIEAAPPTKHHAMQPNGIPSPPQPQSFTRTIPITPSKPPHNKRKSSCCKRMCWTISIILLLLCATAAIFYVVFQPKLPIYSIDPLQISDLTLYYDTSLNTKFDVRITAQNPNKKIGIFYQKGSDISVWYSKTKLCQGSLPRFYHGHQKTTKLNLALTLTAQTQDAIGLMLEEQQQTGRIPLGLKVDVPVRVKLGRFKLREVRVLGKCYLIVDSLSANNLIGISANTCKFRLKL